MAPEYIWLLCGYAGSGKDTSGSLLQNLLGIQHVHLSAFAAAVKDEVAELHSLNRESLDTQEGKQAVLEGRTIRSLLIEHAQGLKEITGNPHIWAEKVQPLPNTKHWILTDWRFLGELDCLKRRFPHAKIHTIRIQRLDIQPLTTETEHELDYFPCEFVVENSGSLLYLANQLKTIVDSILIRKAFLEE